MFKRINYSISDKIHSVQLEGNVMRVLDSTNPSSTLLSVMEKILACDVYSFYDTMDKEEGLDFDTNVARVVLEFDDNCGSIAFYDGRSTIRTKLENFHCIRYTSGYQVRSMLSLVNDSVNRDFIGKDLTVYSNTVPLQKWVALESYFNGIVSYNCVKFNPSNLELTINMVDTEEYSIQDQQLIYLLLSECIATPDNFIRVILLSDLPFKNYTSLINILMKLSGNAMLVFTDTNNSFSTIPVLSN